LESNSILAWGVKQRDLSHMLEMKIPSPRWLYWRCWMWKTSIFAVLCVLFYAAIALLYRLTFLTVQKTRHYPLDELSAAFDIGLSYGYFKGAHFVGLLQPVVGGTIDSSKANITVALHLSYGLMLEVNSYSGYYSHGTSRPYWVGRHFRIETQLRKN